jgi:hypothetical protein
MGKARNVGSAQAQFQGILGTIPQEAKFEIAMVPDSADEVWTDIDTNLDDGEAWYVYGGEYSWDLTAVSAGQPALPNIGAASQNVHLLQVHRNPSSEIRLEPNDPDLMFESRIGTQWDLTTEGEYGIVLVQPIPFGRRTITFQDTLRVLFMTSTDDGAISQATVTLYGRLFYDRVRAPSIGQTKLGMLANL